MSISVTLIYFLDYQKWTYFESHIFINTFCIEFPVVFTANILISFSINPNPTQNWYFWPSDLSWWRIISYMYITTPCISFWWGQKTEFSIIIFKILFYYQNCWNYISTNYKGRLWLKSCCKKLCVKALRQHTCQRH